MSDVYDNAEEQARHLDAISAEPAAATAGENGRFLDLGKPEDVAKLRAIADEVYTAALDLGGTISTQHGTGLARTPWVEKQTGPLFNVFRDLKAIFDPRRIFNPGKVVGSDASVPAWPVRGQGTEVRGQRSEVREQRSELGGQTTVPRGRIKSMRVSNASAMPEGLDAQIDVQQMADLIAFIKGRT